MAGCALCKVREAEIRLDYARMGLCVDCFIKFYERKVGGTIKKFRMFPSDGRVAVAVSGGKDSGALLHVLRTLYPDLELTAIHLNLGIEGYSKECEDAVRKLAVSLDVNLKVFHLEEEGFTIQKLAETNHRRRICSLCGLVKRYWLNRIAYDLGVETLATGHTLDDLAKTALNHYIHGDVESLLKLKPVLPSNLEKKLVGRVKPLCEVTGFENSAYVNYVGVPYTPLRCRFSRRGGEDRKEVIVQNILKVMPSFRHVFFKSHLKRFIPILEKGYEIESDLKECCICGMPTSRDVCAYCALKDSLERKKD
ncbi:adenine nucleotide alpha hydrolase family protein [Candidatus Bathyarchaeota archaeon]|nr:adenine nucleotide alpha hydrolase family protein [Candidatus Bathyarchaeota archaeon]